MRLRLSLRLPFLAHTSRPFFHGFFRRALCVQCIEFRNLRTYDEEDDVHSRAVGMCTERLKPANKSRRRDGKRMDAPAAFTYRQIDLVLDEPCYSLLFSSTSIARVSLCTLAKINEYGIARSSGRVGPGNFEKWMISFVSQSRNRVMELVYSSVVCHVNCLTRFGAAGNIVCTPALIA